MSKTSQKSTAPKVIFRMVAHNSEATITRAAMSVLAQTYTNLELHICIRGSTDNTASIANDLAKKDSRIRVIINKQNFDFDEGNNITDYYSEYDVAKDYVCFMDGDDEYKPDFLEKMIPFAEENNLDIAACGFDVVDVESNQTVDSLKPESTLIVEGEGFDTLFPTYYRYMRTRWAKVFKLSVTDKLDLSRIFVVYYCDDTIETTEYFRNADRIGLYPDTYYKWYRSGGSLSYRWDNRRIEADRAVQDVVTRYLIDKTGQVSPANKEYLIGVYLAAISGTIGVLLLAEIPATEKFEALYDIVMNKYTCELADFPIKFQEQREKLFTQLITWTISHKELCGEEYFDRIADIIFVTKTLPEAFPGWNEADIIVVLSKFQAKFEEVYGKK